MLKAVLQVTRAHCGESDRSEAEGQSPESVGTVSLTWAHLDVAGQQSVEEVHIGSPEVAQVLELLNGSLLEL